MSQCHLVFFNGKMIPANDFLYKNDNVKKFALICSAFGKAPNPIVHGQCCNRGFVYQQVEGSGGFCNVSDQVACDAGYNAPEIQKT
jgi:hypothetical protein